MKKLLLLLLLFPTVLFAQPKGNFISIAMPTLLEPQCPLLRLGYLKNITNRVGFELQAGVGNGIIKIKSNRYQFRGICKFYFYKTEMKNRGYFFIDVFNNTLNQFNNSISYYDGRGYKIFKNAIKEVNKNGLTLGFGNFNKRYGRIYIDMYAGAGFGIRNLQYKKIQEYSYNPTSSDPEGILNFDYLKREGSSLTGCCKMGLNIVFKL